MAGHYDTALLPARPRDRAKLEAAVLIVERWLWAGWLNYSSRSANAARLRTMRRTADWVLGDPMISLYGYDHTTRVSDTVDRMASPIIAEHPTNPWEADPLPASDHFPPRQSNSGRAIICAARCARNRC
jgi:hypothetical protein